jgi:hypothetical protein
VHYASSLAHRNDSSLHPTAYNGGAGARAVEQERASGMGEGAGARSGNRTGNKMEVPVGEYRVEDRHGIDYFWCIACKRPFKSKVISRC